MGSFFLPNWSPPDDPARPLPAEGRPWPSDDDDDDESDQEEGDQHRHSPGNHLGRDEETNLEHDQTSDLFH